MYELPDSLKQKLDSYFLSDDASFLSNWNNWSFISFLEFTKKRRALSIKNKKDLHQRFSNSLNAILMSNAPREVKKVTKALQGEKALLVLVVPTTTPPPGNAFTASSPCYTSTISPYNALQSLSLDASTTTPPPVNTSTVLPPYYTLMTLPGNVSIASSPCYTFTTPSRNVPPPPHYTFTTPLRNAPPPPHYTFTTLPHNVLPPLSQNIFKYFLDIYETSFEMDWVPWKFNITINNVNIECVLMSLHKKCQKTKPKTTTSLKYGIINPNDRIILEALEQSVISHFEAKMQKYKPKKALFAETSLENLGKALDDIKIDYNNLDYDIIYLYCLFKKL
ncbi:3914_t:CDS:2 [Cetraspora pellucida]|uniref:3914_t:CDS:1 n=1 Tax=Cetraspora pellucida TaxID=1433469 RepID=A0ACA9K2R1_9GLOM|nr:3914_t:CDS:2 [Cetraspora pellucida]